MLYGIISMTTDTLMNGPKKGCKYDIGRLYNIVCLGFGRDLHQQKYYIFVDKYGDIFIFTKEEFFELCH